MLLQLDLVGPETLPLLLTLAGLVLSILEAMAPGANFIVVGVALLAAGLAGLLLPVLATPFLLGLMVVVFGAAAFYVYRDLGIYDSEGSGKTTDSSDLKGSMARVTERVSPTEGEVKLDDGGFNPYYSARSMDGEIAEGTRVMVVDPGGGNVVTVEAIESESDEIDRELERERARRAAADEERARRAAADDDSDSRAAADDDSDSRAVADDDSDLNESDQRERERERN
jgi:membrane protein implicated in regulation of membrane protease activity